MLIVITDGGYASYTIEERVAASIGASVEVRQCHSEDDVIDAAHDADAVIARQSPISRRVIEALERCRVVARYGTGLDNIDIPAATERGVVVANVVGFGTNEVAEQAIALLLAGARRIVSHDRAVRRGAWDIAAADAIHRISGSTLGIIGFGAIGRTVMRKLSGFEMRVLAHDPHVDDAEVRSLGAVPADLATLLRESDLITLHAPLTDETHHIIDAAALRLAKPSAVLANTSRGGLVDTEALIVALDEGRLAAAGLDVHEEEPLPMDHPVRDCQRAILLDHGAWYSEEAMEALQRGAIEAVAAVLTGKRPASVVNPEVYDRLRAKD